jgi:transposase InsO family protein
MKYIALVTENGAIKGKIAFCCRMLKVTRQGFYNYLKSLSKPCKYAFLAALIKEIICEDECNDTYGSRRIWEALMLLRETQPDLRVPSQSTIARIMHENGLIQKIKKRPNSLTKADKDAQKSDDLIKRDFCADEPLTKCVSDITEIPTADGKLYATVIEDCFNDEVLGLSMDDNMRAGLCVNALNAAAALHPGLCGAIVHSDRGIQYTSAEYRMAIGKFGIQQSMNSAAGRCHDNAKAESLWGRFKEELLYGRYRTEKMPMNEVKSLIWRYFMGYWNNRRICSANGGLPPAEKRRRFYLSDDHAA